jgi:hypothetical protein
MKSEQWRFSKNDNDESCDNDVDPAFEFGDEIETFNYARLLKVIPSDGITRIVEDEDAEDSYTDSLEEGSFRVCT